MTPEETTTPLRVHKDLKDSEKEAARCHAELPPEAQEYLNSRGINDHMIAAKQIGHKAYGGGTWLTIPVNDTNGNVDYLKLRKFPDDQSVAKYMNYPSGHPTLLFNGDKLSSLKSDEVMIVEGEFDAIVAEQHSLPTTIASTAGATTFKGEWLELLQHTSTVWICLDNDEAGRAGTESLIEKIHQRFPDTTIMRINLPGEIKDLTDYFLAGLSPESLFTDFATHVAGDEPLSSSDFEEMSLNDLTSILDTTVKHDDANKCIVFLGMLTAYTESDQLNIYMLGQSSSGKTYIAKEVSKFFPAEDVSDLAGVSPTAFKHWNPKVDPDTGRSYVDCERKIFIFSEMPHHQLQQNLRPLLSHDNKEIEFRTTDKSNSGGHYAKQTIIRGFPTMVFCSANTNLDEQEATRSLLLSPEANAAKLEAGLLLANERSANPQAYAARIESDSRRKVLRRRVRYIKKLRVNSAIIAKPQMVLERFRALSSRPSPRHARDIAHLNSLVKAVAMLNANHRMDSDNNIVANDADIDAAISLWERISASQMLGITPALLGMYVDCIIPAYREQPRNNQDDGVTQEDITIKYFEVYGTRCNECELRKNILPMLRANGLISQNRSVNDGRRYIYKPLVGSDPGDDSDGADNPDGTDSSSGGARSTPPSDDIEAAPRDSDNPPNWGTDIDEGMIRDMTHEEINNWAYNGVMPTRRYDKQQR